MIIIVIIIWQLQNCLLIVWINQQNITKQSGGVGQTRAKVSLNQYMCKLSWAANGNFQLQLQVPINEEGVFALWHKARLLPNMPKRNLLRGPELPEDFMRNMQIEGKWHQQLYCQIYSKWICNIVHGHHKWIFIEMCKSKSGDSLWHYSQICTNQELLNTAIRCCWEEANLNTITMLITFDFLYKLKRKYNAGCGDTKYAQTEFASEHIVHNGVLLNWNCQARIRRCLGLAAQIKVHIYSVCYAHILFKLKWKQKISCPVPVVKFVLKGK